jgi:hypothetical protein
LYFVEQASIAAGRKKRVLQRDRRSQLNKCCSRHLHCGGRFAKVVLSAAAGSGNEQPPKLTLLVSEGLVAVRRQRLELLEQQLFTLD